MAGSIGSNTFLRFRCPLAAMGSANVETSAPGVDGVAFLVLGKRAEAVWCRSERDFLTLGAAQTARAAYTALMGTLATVTDEHGEVFSLVRVVQVVPGQVIPHEQAVGGVESGNYIVPCQWLLQLTQAPT